MVGAFRLGANVVDALQPPVEVGELVARERTARWRRSGLVVEAVATASSRCLGCCCDVVALALDLGLARRHGAVAAARTPGQGRKQRLGHSKLSILHLGSRGSDEALVMAAVMVVLVLLLLLVLLWVAVVVARGDCRLGMMAVNR